jgi:hypothetical protein
MHHKMIEVFMLFRLISQLIVIGLCAMLFGFAFNTFLIPLVTAEPIFYPFRASYASYDYRWTNFPLSTGIIRLKSLLLYRSIPINLPSSSINTSA